jgi:4-amino-4-deoxy-L-arabinose transferase-like glycosyltransferase
MKLNRSFWICLAVLLAVLAGIEFVGQRALARGDILISVHDELNYIKCAQADYMKIHEGGVFGYLWETLHSFGSKEMLAKEPGTRLASVPLILLNRGADPDLLRSFAFFWLIPASVLLYLALTLLVRPVPALAGSLFFTLSQCTLRTFPHWYQEMTAIPAVCALMLVLFYEVRSGGKENFGWLVTGTVLGAGLLTKISLVFLAFWMFGLLFVLSGRLDHPRIRRARLFKAGLLAYIPASLWWPAHLPYVLKYATAGAFMRHGTLERTAEYFSMYFRTQFVYMYGLWGSLLLLGMAVAAASIALKKICRREFRISEITAGFLAVLIPLAVVYSHVFRGNSLNPRFVSVVIPLAAGAFALVAAQVGKGRRAVWAVLFAGLILQGISVFQTGDWTRMQPFSATPVKPVDYLQLQSVIHLPETGERLKIGFVGNGRTFSPHALAWGFYPHVDRVDAVNLAPVDNRNFNTPMPDLSAVQEKARAMDYVVIPLFRDLREFEDPMGSLEGLYFEKENSLNGPLADILKDDDAFEGPEMLIAEPGFGPDLAVFRRK